MIEIQIAGAGAGKTHGLAKSIINTLASNNSNKKIFAITFTNEARKKIEKEILRQLGSIPERVNVQTVHTFLLNELIYPFSPFILNEYYSSASTINLKQPYKATEIRKLKNMHILHVEEVYSAARSIVDKSMSRHNSQRKKTKVDRVLFILSASIEKIFLDEAQDLDSAALRAFEVLGTEVTDLYMVGDPKQAINYSDSFNGFIEKYQQNVSQLVTILPIINATRRVPNTILNISNRFCYVGQEQTNTFNLAGNAIYIESTHSQFDTFLRQHIASKNSIVCIDKKTEKYATKKDTSISFHPEIQELIKARCANRDPEIFLDAAYLIFKKNVKNTDLRRAVGTLLRDYNIPYTPQIYAQLMEVIVSDIETTYEVSSIHSVKGLEAQTCILILTPNTYKYLAKVDLTSEQEFNIEWKKIYVALTRAEMELILVLDHDHFTNTNYQIDDLKQSLEALGLDEIGTL